MRPLLSSKFGCANRSFPMLCFPPLPPVYSIRPAEVSASCRLLCRGICMACRTTSGNVHAELAALEVRKEKRESNPHQAASRISSCVTRRLKHTFRQWIQKPARRSQHDKLHGDGRPQSTAICTPPRSRRKGVEVAGVPVGRIWEARVPEGFEDRCANELFECSFDDVELCHGDRAAGAVRPR